MSELHKFIAGFTYCERYGKYRFKYMYSVQKDFFINTQGNKKYKKKLR